MTPYTAGYPDRYCRAPAVVDQTYECLCPECLGSVGHSIAGLLGTGVAEVMTLMLVVAVLASLSAGVLLAYGICVAMFKVFRIHSIQVAQQRIAEREAQRMAATGTVDLA